MASLKLVSVCHIMHWVLCFYTTCSCTLQWWFMNKWCSVFLAFAYRVILSSYVCYAPFLFNVNLCHASFMFQVMSSKCIKLTCLNSHMLIWIIILTIMCLLVIMLDMKFTWLNSLRHLFQLLLMHINQKGQKDLLSLWVRVIKDI